MRKRFSAPLRCAIPTSCPACASCVPAICDSVSPCASCIVHCAFSVSAPHAEPRSLLLPCACRSRHGACVVLAGGGPAAGVPARTRRSADARGRRAVPESGGAHRHPRPLPRADAVLAGRVDGEPRDPAARRRRRSKPTRGRSGRCSPTTSTCSAARPAAHGSRTSSRACSASPSGSTARRRRASTTGSTSSSRSPSSGRARCSSGSGSRCSARPTPRPTRSSGTAHIRESGWTGDVAADVPAGPRYQHPAPGVEAARSSRLGALTGREVRDYRTYIRRARGAARVLQVDGRDGDRPRRRDAVHVRAVARRGDDAVRARAEGLRDRCRRRGRSRGTC